ncbi:MAG: hypothetical protein CME60_10320 [Halobacteriovoraceae bacterium]|nr:hypothetical protein [Halobacteriovoraceae bacterium]
MGCNNYAKHRNKKIPKSVMKKFTDSLYFFSLSLGLVGVVELSSCAAPSVKNREEGVRTSPKQILRSVRLPSSESVTSTGGCFSQLIPILREGAIYSDESLSPENLSARGVIELAVFDELSESSLWQEVVAREGMSERDRELGFLSLALLKKRYRDISDEALKDRYEVLRSFCGS